MATLFQTSSGSRVIELHSIIVLSGESVGGVVLKAISKLSGLPRFPHEVPYSAIILSAALRVAVIVEITTRPLTVLRDAPSHLRLPDKEEPLFFRRRPAMLLRIFPFYVLRLTPLHLSLHSE